MKSNSDDAARAATATVEIEDDQTNPAAEPLAERVAFHPFLVGMKRAHLEALTASAASESFQRGQVVLCEGAPADRFYLIETGSAIIESGAGLGDAVIVDRINPGDLLGWSWLFPPYVWHFTARADEPVSALSFEGAVLREQCEKDAALGYELLKRAAAVMLRRMQAARDQMLAVNAGISALQRVPWRAGFEAMED